MVQLNFAWVTIITISSAPRLRTKSTRPLVILDTVKMYLGT